MKIIITGATGLIGSHLVPQLVGRNHHVTRFVRQSSTQVSGANARDVLWNPARGEIDESEIARCDAVIHLAGESVAEGRWTDEKKQRILSSRVDSTTLLARTIKDSAIKDGATHPRLFLSASATGFYGERGDEVLTEDSTKGEGFLADVVARWEAAAHSAIDTDAVRVCFLRFGVILSSRGGALAKMLPPFRAGLGGQVGSGRQFMSWISLDDAVSAILFQLENEAVRGVVNVVAPHAVTNAEFTAALAKTIKRPSMFTVPGFALRLAFGEMANETLLISQRVVPRVLSENNFSFKHERIEDALRDLLT